MTSAWPAEGTDWVAVTERLAVGDETGDYIVVFLSPTIGEAEFGDHLIEDYQHAMRREGGAHSFDKTWFRRRTTLQWLDDHRCRLVRVTG